MQLMDLFLTPGEEKFAELMRHISMSRLRTYQIYEHIKVRTRLVKLNSEHLRKAVPKLWTRLKEGDADLATDLSQAILVSNLDMIVAALDLLGIPHQDGFFSKDADIGSYLKEGWQEKTYSALKDRFPASVLEFYLNHLAVETGHAETPFVPA
jgi:hypothetical protein